MIRSIYLLLFKKKKQPIFGKIITILGLLGEGGSFAEAQEQVSL